MLNRIIFSIFLINFYFFSYAFSYIKGEKDFFDDNLFLVDSEESKKSLEKILQKTGKSTAKIIIAKEDDNLTKPQVTGEKEEISGYFFTGEVGNELKIQMDFRLPLPFGSDTKLPSALSPEFFYGDILKKGNIPIEGEYFYEEYGKKLSLAGFLRDNGDFELSEYYHHREKNEKIEKITTGKFIGKLKGDFTEGSGKWISPDGKKSFDFIITKKATYRRVHREYKINRIIKKFSLDEMDKMCINDDKCLKNSLMENKYGLTNVDYTYVVFEGENFTKINKILNDKKEEILKNGADLAINAVDMFTHTLGLSVDYDIAYFSKNLVSLLIHNFEYSGGAHPNHFTQSISLLLGKKSPFFEPVELFDLIDKSDTCRKQLVNLLFKELKRGEKRDHMFGDSEVKELLGNIIKNNSNPSNFFDKNGITFIFSPYDIGPYASGYFEAKVSYSDLIKVNCVPKDSPLMELINKKKEKTSDIKKSEDIKKPKDGLIAHYSFDELFSDNIIKDLSGKGNDLSVTNGILKFENGILGKAINFDGTYYLKANTNPLSMMDEFTISLWFNTKNPKNNIKLIAAAWWQGGNNASGWNIGTHYSEFWADNMEGSLRASDHWNRNADFFDGGWNHLVVTVNKKEIREYINGKLSFKGPSTGKKLGEGSPMTVGSWNGGFKLIGLMDELKIYSKSLGERDIIKLYESYAKNTK